MAAITVVHLVEDLDIGGLERVVQTLYAGLDRERYQVAIWCLARGGSLAAQLRQQGEAVQVLGLTNYHNPLTVCRLAMALHKADVKLVHTHGYFAGVMGRLAAWLARVPVRIHHVHTADHNLTRRHRRIERLLSLVTSDIVCCSEHVRDFVVQHEGIAATKVSTLYNGVAAPPTRPTRHMAPPFTIAVTASLVANKGHRFLLEALARLHGDWRLLIAGDGPLRDDLFQLAQRLHLSDRIEFLGCVTDIAPVLNRADLLVLPTIEREGMGMALVEAMAYGLPVIGTRVGGIPEIIVDGETGFIVPPRDVAALADRLQWCCFHRDSACAMGAAGRRRYAANFSAAGMLSAVANLYRRHLPDPAACRILYLHNNTQISGGEHSLLNLWRQLRSTPHTLHLMIPEPGPLVERATAAGVQITFNAIPSLRPRHLFGIMRAAWRLAAYCRSQHIDIIHSYTPRNNLLAAVVAKLMPRTRVLWHERNIPVAGEPDISRRFLALADAVVCNSAAVAARFQQRNGKLPAKVKIIHNGVDSELFCPGPAPSELLARYALANKLVIGLVSNLGKRKCPETMLQAAPTILAACPQAVLMLVGGEFGAEDHGREAELRRLARDLGIAANVIFTGFVDNVVEHIRTFALAVAVTEQEACSRAILEIMATGIPVVGFATGGNPELIDHDSTGILVDYGDTAALANAVIALLNDAPRRTSLGQQARQRVITEFAVSANARRTQALYAQLRAD